MPLPIGLPRGDALSLRATLAREILHASGSLMLPSDDAIALGLVAIEQAVVAWYDKGLVRRSLRSPLAPAALGEDLARHYVELLHDVLDTRTQAGLGGAFPAAQYFRVLPAHGPLPKAAIDPVNGSQVFFPKAYEVSIAPVRRSDLPRLLADSSLLAPIDLTRDADIDVMVLVPMDDASFALRARQLEADPVTGTLGKTGILAHLDVFALRLYAPPALGTEDRRTWEQIWAAVAPSDVRYVRRPPRTAETNVSAVVLARGFELPDLEKGLPPDLEGLEKLGPVGGGTEAFADGLVFMAQALLHGIEQVEPRQRQGTALAGTRRRALVRRLLRHTLG